VKRQSSPGATLASKRTAIVRASTGSGGPRADERRAVIARDAAEQVVERHRRIGEADHAEREPGAEPAAADRRATGRGLGERATLHIGRFRICGPSFTIVTA
jgi:hypothetical protein